MVPRLHCKNILPMTSVILVNDARWSNSGRYMAIYNLHLIGRGSGNWCTIEIAATSDEEAAALSRQLYPTLPMELWRGPHLVQAFPGCRTARAPEADFNIACAALHSIPQAGAYRLKQCRQRLVEDRGGVGEEDSAASCGLDCSVAATADDLIREAIASAVG